MVELLTQEELDDREASITTQVRGLIQNARQPLNAIKVQLFKADADAKPATDAATKPSQPIAVAITQADGRFILENIASGEYRLEVSGIVRGMREKRTQAIVVDARKGPVDVSLRLDKNL